MTALFFVASPLSARPIDPARATAVSCALVQGQAALPMEPLISIVDDDKAVRDALRRVLSSRGFTATVFASAEQFLDSDERNRASCLIADVRMPGMTGMALHRYLMSQGCRVPTILITARPTSGERKRALATGVISYLAKPVREQVLLDTVCEALENGRQVADRGLPGR